MPRPTPPSKRDPLSLARHSIPPFFPPSTSKDEPYQRHAQTFFLLASNDQPSNRFFFFAVLLTAGPPQERKKPIQAKPSSFFSSNKTLHHQRFDKPRTNRKAMTIGGATGGTRSQRSSSRSLSRGKTYCAHQRLPALLRFPRVRKILGRFWGPDLPHRVSSRA